MQAKAIEEGPAGTDGSPVQSAWAKAGTVITATLQLEQPLYPPWQPPPAPAVTLQQLIPKREYVKQEVRVSPSQQFQAEVKAAAKKLAVSYHAVRGSCQESDVCPFQQQGLHVW